MRAINHNALASAVVSLLLWFMLLGASYEAVLAIQEPWHAVDYWLAWFSGFTLLGGVIAGMIFGIQLYIALGGE